jgi:hypothetical protein
MFFEAETNGCDTMEGSKEIYINTLLTVVVCIKDHLQHTENSTSKI